MSWKRGSHDTMTGGLGSDPHGWRNALNYYGWGSGTLVAGTRVYDDVAFSSYDGAMRATLRALIATGKPVGVLGWRGGHAQMISGYYGLVGDPFAGLSHNLKADDLFSEIGTVEPDSQDCFIEALKL